ncbi:MAG: serine hydrolase domain-containing protein [Pacificimonas sp.]|nr:serine hydrolase domain-containing protein [Pacificimonas sp.]
MQSVIFRTLFTLAVLWAVPVAAQERLEQYIAAEMDAASVPGAAWAIVDGNRIDTGASGVERLGKAEQVTDRTPFFIGSISKSFVALSIMQLVEEGRIDLNSPVERYLPALARQPIGARSLRQLLSHQSGLSTLQGNRLQGDFSMDDAALERRATDIGTVVPETEAEEVWSYSNANYALAGGVVEAVSGRDFGAYVEQRILAPLGMDDSYVHGASRVFVGGGHRTWFGGRTATDKNMTGRGSGPQGGVVSTAADMGTYLAAMMNGRDDVVSAKSKTLMMQPVGSAAKTYGLGWEVYPEEGRVRHAGSMPGFEALATMVPAERRGFVMLTNAGMGFAFDSPASLLGGASAKVLSLDPPEGSGGGLAAAFVGLCVLPFLFLFGAWRTWRRRRALTRGLVAYKIWLPLIAALGLSIAMLVGLPNQFGVNIRTTLIFSPDLGAVLIAVAATALGWAAVNAGLRLRASS